MKIFLIISQVVYALFLILWFTFWAMSAMMFDAGSTPTVIALFSAISAYPVAAVVCSIVAWILHRRRKPRGALVVDLIPALWVIAILGVLAFVGFQGMNSAG